MKKILLIFTISISIFLYFTACKPIELQPTSRPIPGPTPVIIYYPLTINTDPASIGVVQKNPNRTQYAANTQVTLQAGSAIGYAFDHWEGDLTGTTNPVTISMASAKNITAVFVPAKWTIMVYMDGDNNLEEYAIQDINEMESVDLTDTDVEIIVLFDRISGEDSSNGDWTNTRLYKVNYDSSVYNTTIVSTRLASGELGLTIDGDEELNMGDPANISNFIAFCKANYQADYYSLIFWNHGSGWRSRSAPETPATRVVCTDDTSGDKLYTQEIHTGLDGSNIDIVAFDLCYGAMLEVMYEIRNDAAYMIASEETEPLAGWDYNLLLNNFKTAVGIPALNFINSTVDAFAASYSIYASTTLSGVDLSKINAVMNAFNAFSAALYADITSTTIKNEIYSLINNYVEDYYDGKDSDWNIDLWDLAEQIQTRTNYADAEAAALKTAIDTAVVAEWHHTSVNPRSHGIAVHFAYVNSEESVDITASSDAAYWKGNTEPYSLSFVADSQWVPVYPSGPGLLYRLLVEAF